MRLLQLNPDGTEESALDFHPILTVVNGLGVGGRDVVIRAITAMARGEDPGIGGLLEAHGVMLDLTPTTLSMLDVHGDLDALLDRADVPARPQGASPPVDTSVRPSAEQLLQSTAPGVDRELDEARKRQSDAAEALAVLRDATERSQHDLQQANRRLDRARSAVDGARAALEAALAGLEADSTTLEELSAEEITDRRREVAEDVEQLRADLARIERGLDELSGIDTRPVQVLLDAIANPEPVELVPSERAQELADDFVRLQAEVKELEVRLVGVGRDPASANAQLEAARDELARAEKGMAKPDLSAEDVAELEAAHEAVLEAERKASGRFSRNKSALEAAMAREQEILDRVGFPTWSAYVMGSGLLAIDPAAEDRLEKARFDFEAAEANWAQVSEAIESDPELSALLDQLEAVYLEAFDLLGGEEPDDLEAALRGHREPKREVSTQELIDALAYQLEVVGLDLGPTPTLDRTVVVAEAFLAETSSLTDRVTELEAERHHVSGALEEAEEELATLPTDGSPIDVTQVPAPHVDVHLTPEDVAELEAELAAAQEAVVEAADRAEAREALLDAATQVQAVATARLMKVAGDLAERAPDGVATSTNGSNGPAEFAIPVDEPDDGSEEALEFYLLARLAALRNVSFAGAVPFVVDDAFGGMPRAELRKLLGKLERMAEAVQIIYLTDDGEVTEWANEVGFQRAAVVDATAPFQ